MTVRLYKLTSRIAIHSDDSSYYTYYFKLAQISGFLDA